MSGVGSPLDYTGRKKAELDAKRRAEFSQDELIEHAKETGWREGFSDGLRQAVKLSQENAQAFAELVTEITGQEDTPGKSGE